MKNLTHRLKYLSLNVWKTELVIFKHHRKKIRDFANVNTLKTIYYAIFDLHIDYAIIWFGLKF